MADCVNNYNVKCKSILKKDLRNSELVMWLGFIDSWHLKLEKAQQNQVCKMFGREHINDISGQGIRSLKRCASMQDDNRAHTCRSGEALYNEIPQIFKPLFVLL